MKSLIFNNIRVFQPFVHQGQGLCCLSGSRVRKSALSVLSDLNAYITILAGYVSGGGQGKKHSHALPQQHQGDGRRR